MRCRSRRVFLLATVLLLVLLPIPASARLTQSDLVLVRADDVITEDLYAAGNRVAIEGRIEGDLLAAAFEDVVISGEVTGDVVVAASKVTINGTIGGSVRVSAGTVEVGGSIGEDLAAVSWNTFIGPNAVIGRDLINWGRNGRVEGEVDRDLTGRFSRLTIDGQVGGSVDVNVGVLVVGATAAVEGDVAYRSSREAEVNSSLIGGSVVQRTPLPLNIELRALQLLTVIIVLFFLTATGLLVTILWPEQLESAMAAAGRGWRAWLGGLGVLVSPLLGAGVFGVLVGLAPPAAAVPLAIVFLPVILGLGGLVLLAAIFGVIPAAAAVGRVVMRGKASAAAAVLLGMFLFGIVMLIPWLRWVAVALAVPVGVGSLLGKRSLQVEESDRGRRSIGPPVNERLFP